ncbi:MAG: MBL fold metallo-hydrolase [Eubacteriales bacterium]|nr:MBL fold metallo-hydrolase [Eubacteriales bacterium]
MKKQFWNRSSLMIGVLAAMLTACSPEDMQQMQELAEQGQEAVKKGQEAVKQAEKLANQVKDAADQVKGATDQVREATDQAKQFADQMQEDGQSQIPAEDSSFEVHYIDVGQADAALVLCDGQSMLIDGGNREDSSLIYTYLSDMNLDHLDYIVCTHAHEDHVGGLAGALNAAKADTAFSPVTEYDSKVFQSFKKYLAEQDTELTVPEAGDTFALGSAQVQVLGPVQMEHVTETNNTSIVLKVEYGETSFLFTGDAEREEEQDILDAGFDVACTVLKVGHHGGETSTSYRFLREAAPEYAVISVGEGNQYGHPTEEVLSRLRDADVEVYRTDEMGDIICSSDGKEVSFRTER